MKSLKLMSLMCAPVAALSLTVVLSGCGASSGEFETKPNTLTNNSVNPVVVNPTPTPVGSVPTPTPVPTANSCGKQIVDRPVYRYRVVGSGTGTATTPTIPANVVDQMLKVRITPDGATNSKTYSKLAATVKIVRNGAVQSASTVSLPGETDTQGYKKGISINAGSTIKDFSSMGVVQSGATYAIQVSGVMSDYNCNTNLRVNAGNYYCYSNPYPYVQSCYGTDAYTGTAYTWNWDYHTQAYYCCAGNNLQQSQQQQCGVGAHNTTALNVGWSMYVEIETDTSECLQ